MNDSIIEKIQHLRKLSASSNIAEATTAALIADKLISKFRISEEEINAHATEKPEQSGDILYESARSITWKSNLASRLSKHYGCFIYNDTARSEKGRQLTRLRLVGLKSDMSLVHYMFNWLVFEIERLNKKNKGQGHIFCNSFCEGAVSGITQQLQASKEEEKKEATVNNQSQALATLDARHALAESYIRGIMKLKTVNKPNYSHLDGNAYDDGVKAGKNLHLGKVMTGVGNKLLSK
jgi:hypothetical protein